MKIVVKVGTQSILAKDGSLCQTALLKIVNQIARLKAKGVIVVLVSSGAVASGRGALRQLMGREYGTSAVDKQLLASIGQPELMHAYSKIFKEHNLLTAQILLTKQDFHTRQHYLNIASLMQEIIKNRSLVPIINENDSVSINELMFTDNDELAGLMSALLGVDKLIILTSVKGVYNGHPDDPNSKIISVIEPKRNLIIDTSKSSQGRGGMMTKTTTAQKMSDLGITTHIAHAHEEDVLIKIIDDIDVGTKVLPLEKKSSMKRYLAFNCKPSSGQIKINACLFDKLTKEEKVLSILPIGVESFCGNFEKGDLLEILGPTNQKVGIGIARYGMDKLSQVLGQKNKPELIHYDHLHVFLKKEA